MAHIEVEEIESLEATKTLFGRLLEKDDCYSKALLDASIGNLLSDNDDLTKAILEYLVKSQKLSMRIDTVDRCVEHSEYPVLTVSEGQYDQFVLSVNVESQSFAEKYFFKSLDNADVFRYFAKKMKCLDCRMEKYKSGFKDEPVAKPTVNASANTNTEEKSPAKPKMTLSEYFFLMYDKDPHYFDDLIGEEAVARINRKDRQGSWLTPENICDWTKGDYYDYVKEHHGFILNQMLEDYLAEQTAEQTD